MDVYVYLELATVSEIYMKALNDLPVIAQNNRIDDDRTPDIRRDGLNWLLRCRRKMDAVYDFYKGTRVKRLYSCADFVSDALYGCGFLKIERKGLYGCIVEGTVIEDTPEKQKALVQDRLDRQMSFVTGANKCFRPTVGRLRFIENGVSYKTSIRFGFY